MRPKPPEFGRRPGLLTTAAGPATPAATLEAKPYPAAPGVSATTTPATTGGATATPFSLDASQVCCAGRMVAALSHIMHELLCHISCMSCSTLLARHSTVCEYLHPILSFKEHHERAVRSRGADVLAALL